MTIKAIFSNISKVIADIINLSFTSGAFPAKLKIAPVGLTPIFKSGAKDDPINYRPISILLIFSKIFEKVVVNRLTTYLFHNDILSAAQHGLKSIAIIQPRPYVTS